MRLAALSTRRGLALGLASRQPSHDGAGGTLPDTHWSFDGPFGTFDRASEQRGLQVWQEVCSNCHSMKEAYYRNLDRHRLTADQVKAFASRHHRAWRHGRFSGQPVERPALPADHFRSPFPNDKAARAANNGALPPDHSLIEKAREGGATYVSAALLKGYRDPPAGMKMGDGMNYNIYFPGRQIAMAQPLHDGQVTYAGRHARHGRADVPRRHHLPDLHGQSGDGAAQADGRAHRAVPGRHDRRHLRREAEDLVGPALAGMDTGSSR